MCTRVMYTPKKQQSYVGRNMDWSEAPDPNLWVFPSKMERQAMAKERGKEEFQWTSAYSSIVTSNYDIATSDGMNSKGLTANLLWLARSEYPSPIAQKKKYPMCMSVWTQYLLDTCASVLDALIAMDHIYIQSAHVPGRTDPATCHLSVGDKAGNSVIFEYIDGQLMIHTNVKRPKNQPNTRIYSKKKMRVMTNDPEFNKQVSSLTYWNELNDAYQNEKGDVPAQLPGSNLALNRFIRASYYSSNLKDNVDNTLALAGLSAVTNNTAQTPVLLGAGSPKLSRTQYSSFADCSRLQYFYRSNYGPFIIWINLNDVDFDKLKDDTSDEEVYAFKLELDKLGVFRKKEVLKSGNVTGKLKKAKPFDFIRAI